MRGIKSFENESVIVDILLDDWKSIPSIVFTKWSIEW